MIELVKENIDYLVERLFTYHAPDGDDALHYAAINDAAKAYARIIYEHTPCGADQAAAIRKVREARMTANAAIACRER